MERRPRRYADADRILARLKNECGVAVDDRAREWYFAAAAPGGERPPLAFDGNVETLEPRFLKAVELILARRRDAQARRDFQISDALRDELWRTYQVAVHDRDGKWRWVGRPAPGEGS